MSELVLNWQQIASFWVPATPVAQPRPRARAIRRGGKWIGTVYNPDDADPWKRAVAIAGRSFQPAEPITGPVGVDIVFHLPRPKYMNAAKYPSGPIPHLAVPDKDNLEKAVLDAMSDAGWWRNDSQVCAGEPVKVYHARGAMPGARIVVSVIADDERNLF